MWIALNYEFVIYIRSQEYGYKMKEQGRFC